MIGIPSRDSELVCDHRSRIPHRHFIQQRQQCRFDITSINDLRGGPIQQQNDFTFHAPIGNAGSDFSRGAPHDFFEFLGQLPAQDRKTIRVNFAQNSQRLLNAPGTFEDDRGGIRGGNLGKPCAPCPHGLWREAREQEAIAGKPGHHQRSQRGRCTRNCVNLATCSDGFTRQPKARIGHQGRPRIRTIGNGLASIQRLDQEAALPILVMVVIGNDPPPAQGHAVDTHQMPQGTRIFGSKDICRVQHIQRPQGDVTGRPDGGRHKIQAGIQPGGLDPGGKRSGGVALVGHVRLAWFGPRVAKAGRCE